MKTSIKGRRSPVDVPVFGSDRINKNYYIKVKLELRVAALDDRTWDVRGEDLLQQCSIK